jgi:ribA/ribD-fused uncharacterized protein
MLPQEVYVTYFSPFSPHAIEYQGVVYPTVEHAYHCQRYSDAVIREEIRAARSPAMAWEVSQKYKACQLADFPARKFEVMEELCRAKLAQHEDVRLALADTGALVIVKHIFAGPPGDGVWDDGPDGRGRNEGGQIWMRLRDEL